MSAEALRLDPGAWGQSPEALARFGRKLWTATAALLLLFASLAVTLAVTTDDADAHPGVQQCWVIGYETVQWGSQPYQTYQRPIYWCYWWHEDHNWWNNVPVIPLG